MEFKDFTAGEDDNDRRLDRILRIFLKDTSLGQLYKLLRKDLIKVNHKKAVPELHIKTGDIISIAAFLFASQTTEATKTSDSPQPLTIVFENQHLLIIDKPYGRSVHGEKDGINHDVLEYLEAKTQQEKRDSISFRPGPLHRLDERTTGLLAFSKSLEGARWFSDGIKNHTIQKKYIGLAQGKLENEEEWKDCLIDKESSQGFFTVKIDKSGKGAAAETKVRPLAYGLYNKEPVTLVEYQIKTGRKHQIRCQSAAHGHPLLGDTAYGGQTFDRGFLLRSIELKFPQDNPLGLPPLVKTGLTKEIITILHCCEIENPGL